MNENQTSALKQLRAAISFLTIFPIGLSDEESLRKSLRFFSVTGILLGVLSAASAILAYAYSPPTVAAGLIVMIFVAFSGGLHLDGLADSADGFMSHTNKERMLEIMHDSRSGAMGVIAIVLALIVKFATLAEIPVDKAWIAVLFAPIAGRVAIMYMTLALPPAREDGLGRFFKCSVNLKTIFPTIVICMALGYYFPELLLYNIFLCTAAIFLWSRYCISKIGGTTGDTCGAACEIAECASLLATTFMFHNGGIH